MLHRHHSRPTVLRYPRSLLFFRRTLRNRFLTIGGRLNTRYNGAIFLATRFSSQRLATLETKPGEKYGIGISLRSTPGQSRRSGPSWAPRASADASSGLPNRQEPVAEVSSGSGGESCRALVHVHEGHPLPVARPTAAEHLLAEQGGKNAELELGGPREGIPTPASQKEGAVPFGARKAPKHRVSLESTKGPSIGRSDSLSSLWG
jgi:hypothetical protein